MNTTTTTESAGNCGQSANSADNMRTCATCSNDLVCHDLGKCQQPTPDYGEPWKPFKEEPDLIYDKCSYWMADAVNPVIRDRIICCVNACQGMADPASEIQAMREAITKADSALRKCLNHLLIQPIFARNSSDIERESETMESVHVALGKLQPLIIQEP